MLELLRIAIGLVPEIGDNPESEILCLVRLSVMLADKRDKTLCQSDEADAESPLVYH